MGWHIVYDYLYSLNGSIEFLVTGCMGVCPIICLKTSIVCMSDWLECLSVCRFDCPLTVRLSESLTYWPLILSVWQFVFLSVRLRPSACLLPLLEMKFDPVCSSVGRSVCHNFQKRADILLPCSYRSICFSQFVRFYDRLSLIVSVSLSMLSEWQTDCPPRSQTFL